MGVDIHGWVEVRDRSTERWHGIVFIDHLVSRTYDAFGCLFGVRNDAHFRPLAQGRGLPADVSDEARQLAYTQMLVPTWIGWSAIKAMDREESAKHPDARLRPFFRQPDGSLVAGNGKALVPRLTNYPSAYPGPLVDDPNLPIFEPAQEWEIDSVIWRTETLRRKDAFDAPWRALFRMMETMADAVGEHDVRLVVWFDA